MSNGGFDLALAIRIADPAGHGGHGIMSQRVAVDGVQRGIVDVGSQYAFAQIVEDYGTRGPAEPGEGFLMELGPDTRTGTEGEQANRFAAPRQGEYELPGAPVPAAAGIAHHRTAAVIDLSLFSRRRCDDRVRL